MSSSEDTDSGDRGRPEGRPGDRLAGRSSLPLETGSALEILRVVCREAATLLGGESACITAPAERGDALVIRAASGFLRQMEGARFDGDRSVSGRAMRQGEPVIADGLQESSLGREARRLSHQIRTALSVPLAGAEGPLGTVVVVNAARADGFTPEDARLLEAFAAPAAAALREARLHEAAERRAARLASARAEEQQEAAQLRRLHEASVAMTSDMDLEDLLHTIVEGARDLLGAERAALGILDPGGTELSRFITAGLTDDEREAYGEPPTGKGLLGAVIEEGRTIRVDDAREHDEGAGVPGGHHPVGTFLGTPIRTEGEIYGNLYLTNKKIGDGFSSRDEVVLEMLAAQAAVAIQKLRLFEERGRLVERLERSQKRVRRMSAFISHDIRNALSGVALWAERLERKLGESDAGKPEWRQIASKVLRGSEHALRLVRDVVDLARVEEGRLELWPRSTTVADAVDAALDATAADAERRNVSVEPAGISRELRIVADPDRVLQILSNLVGNAVRFSPDGGTVRVGAERRESGPADCGPEDVEDWSPCVAVWVEDEGPGIPEEERDRIFGLFQQAGDPSARRGGVGIGLALSLRLARMMDGTLTVESEVGEGSRFTLWLPVDAEAEARPGWIG